MTQLIDKDFVVSFIDNKPNDVERWSFAYQGLNYTCYEDSTSECATTQTHVYVLFREWTKEEEQNSNFFMDSPYWAYALVYSHASNYHVYPINEFNDTEFSLYTYMDIMMDDDEKIDLMYYKQPEHIQFDGRVIDHTYYPSAEWVVESYEKSEPYNVDYCEGKYRANYSIELLTTEYELLEMKLTTYNGYDFKLDDFYRSYRSKPTVCCDNMKLERMTMTFDGGNSSLFFRPEVHVQWNKAELIVCRSCKKYH